jgi:hypothetical protein
MKRTSAAIQVLGDGIGLWESRHTKLGAPETLRRSSGNRMHRQALVARCLSMQSATVSRFGRSHAACLRVLGRASRQERPWAHVANWRPRRRQRILEAILLHLRGVLDGEARGSCAALACTGALVLIVAVAACDRVAIWRGYGLWLRLRLYLCFTIPLSHLPVRLHDSALPLELCRPVFK